MCQLLIGLQQKKWTKEAEREKVIQSREIPLQRIHALVTVRDLSKKMGINQCYLKRGFKELFGTITTEFQQGLRMERASFFIV